MRSRNQRSCEMTTTQPGNVEQRLLERAQRVDVEIVRRLVEQQQVAAALQQLGQMQAIALAARERADLLLLIAALEVEPRHVRARVDRLLAEDDLVLAAGDLLPHGLVGVQRLARLIDVADLHGLADLAACRRPAVSCPTSIRNSVVLPAPFGPITPTMPPRGSVKSRSSIEQQVAVALAQIARFDDDVAETRAGRNVDLDAVDLLRRVLGEQLLRRRSVAPCPWPGARAATCESTRARAAASAAACVSCFSSTASRCCFCSSHDGVVPFPRKRLRAIELENPAGDVVEEVAIVRDRDDRAFVFLEEVLEPGDRLGVEMVGRLVEQQQVRRLQQQPAQRDAAPLAARELRRRRHRPAAAAARPSRARASSRDPRRRRLRSRPAPSPAPRAPCPSSSGDMSSPNFALISSKRVSSARIGATPSSTLPSTFLDGSSCGSCGR